MNVASFASYRLSPALAGIAAVADGATIIKPPIVRRWSSNFLPHFTSSFERNHRLKILRNKSLLVRPVSTGRPPTDNANDNADVLKGDIKRCSGADSSSVMTTRSQFLVAGGQFFPFLAEVGKVAALLATLTLGLLYVNQEKMLYLPELDEIPRHLASNPPGYRSPSEYDLPFENHMIKTGDGTSIHAWLLLHPTRKEEKLPSIIFFHGNAGNIGIRLPNAQQMFAHLKANVLMVEYRGYGDSEDAKPNEMGLKLDAEAAFHFLRDHPMIDSNRIFLFGRSLGGAVAFQLAQYAEQNGLPLAGLIVENTFVSVGGMVDAVLPIFSPFKRLLLRMDWDSTRVAPTIAAPILYLAGNMDEIVPHDHMKELYGLSLKSSVYARMHVVEGGTHNETWLQGGSRYWEKQKEFLSEALAFGDIRDKG